MRIHIVEPYKSPAMRRFVDPLYQHIPPGWVLTEGDTPDPTANVNLHIPWHTAIVPTKSDVVLFTHVNPGYEGNLQEVLSTCRHVIVMSTQGEHIVRKHGYTGGVTVAVPGVDIFHPRKIRVGIASLVQQNGRKREWLLQELAWKYNLTPFHFVIIGDGWDNVVESLKSLGVSVEYQPHKMWEDVPQFYQNIDVLLSTGFVEGGPLPVIEALASGIPCLCPPYGLALDYLPPEYLYNSVDELYQILREFVQPIQNNVQRVDRLTDALMCEKILGACIEYSTGNRYDHVAQTIRDEKAKVIVEIGVAQGTRSIDMIRAAQESEGSVEYFGFDLFRQLTSEELSREFSKQPGTIQDISLLLKNVAHDSTTITLVPGDTRDTLKEYNIHADVIFLDGGHSWETIESDWRNIQNWIYGHTVVLLDDYYPQHPEGIGCQRLIDSLDRDYWDIEFLHPIETWGSLDIQMVKVMRRE